MIPHSIKFILVLLVLFGSCKQKEVMYTVAEAERIADSVTRDAIEKINREAAVNLEFRKRVETPYKFGVRTGSPVKNPYDTLGYEAGKRNISNESVIADDSSTVKVHTNQVGDPRLRKVKTDSIR